MIPVQHIHPMLVHFPIVLIFLLAIFDLTSALRGNSVSGRTVAGNISAALAVMTGIFAVATFYFGGMALDVAEAGGFHSDIAEIHESLGSAVAIAAGLYALIRAGLWLRDVRLKGALNLMFPVAAVFGAVMVTATAYYGGQLVYELGVNVSKIAMN